MSGIQGKVTCPYTPLAAGGDKRVSSVRLPYISMLRVGSRNLWASEQMDLMERHKFILTVKTTLLKIYSVLWF